MGACLGSTDLPFKKGGIKEKMEPKYSASFFSIVMFTLPSWCMEEQPQTSEVLFQLQEAVRQENRSGLSAYNSWNSNEKCGSATGAAEVDS